ncbi:hypothetical protein ASZ90_009885 [hydrocarbon metagenome]|uniref:Uncharacterized protein n=1 Tax=hydrocarbon metagenome TaxID=938273 RepID=A0A0W8FHM4_9ZZZZ
MLEEVYFSLPGRINALELVNFAHVQETPFKINLSPDALKFDYYLVKIPVNILLPETTKIEVLAMKAEIISMGEINREIIAYDIFPKDTPRTREIAKGNLKIGISDVLTFVPHPAIQPLSKCLDCNIEFPIKWESKSYEIETSDTGSNPVYWRVNDEFIAGCFEAYCIIQAPKGIPVSLRVNLEGKAKPSLHATLMNMIFRNPVATFRADEQIYQIN